MRLWEPHNTATNGTVVVVTAPRVVVYSCSQNTAGSFDDQFMRYKRQIKSNQNQQNYLLCNSLTAQAVRAVVF